MRAEANGQLSSGSGWVLPQERRALRARLPHPSPSQAPAWLARSTVGFAGRVVDALGRPLAGAVVMATRGWSGPAVTTDDEEVAKTIKMLREHGQVQKYYHDLEGYNGRLDAIQAALLRIKLRHLQTWNDQRRAAAGRYDQLLSGMPGLVTPYQPETSKAIYHLYVVRTGDRDGLAEELKGNGIHTGLHYPLPVHLQNCYRPWGYQKGSLPVTERIAGEILSLPMFPGLTAPQQQRVAAAIETFLGVTSQKAGR